MAAEKKQRGALELVLFSLPAAPLFALALPLGIFLPPYYAAHLGVPLAVVSAIFVGARLFDLVLDPMLGGWEDRTNTSFGRRRLWILISAPVLMAATWFCFVGLWEGAPPLAASLGIFALYAAYAAMSIAHLSWGGELRPSYHGRTASLGAIQTAGLVGQVSMLVLAAYVVQSGLGDDADAVHVMGYVVLALIPICVLLCVFGVKEKDLPPQPHLGFRAAMGAIARNANLRRVLLPDLLTGVSAGVQGGLFLFFFQHVLLFWRESQTLLAIFFIAGLVGAPLWIWMGHRIGKHRALQVACAMSAVTTMVLPFFPKGEFLLAALFMFVGGIPTAASGILLRAMMADVVDEDELTTGARRTGLFFGVLLTTNKIGLVTGPLSYVFLNIAGFDPAARGTNTPEAITMLSILFVAVPLALFILAALSLNGYPIDEERQAATRASLEAREAAA